MECSSNKSGIARNISQQPFVAFKRNKDLQEIIGHTIKNWKVLKAHLENRKENATLAT